MLRKGLLEHEERAVSSGCRDRGHASFARLRRSSPLRRGILRVAEGALLRCYAASEGNQRKTQREAHRDPADSHSLRPLPRRFLCILSRVAWTRRLRFTKSFRFVLWVAHPEWGSEGAGDGGMFRRHPEEFVI
jgi:hypothetical protein